jgi:hypothetical protein
MESNDWDEIKLPTTKEFDKYIDKEFEFEIQYHLWVKITKIK